jgi:hypothetical protein
VVERRRGRGDEERKAWDNEREVVRREVICLFVLIHFNGLCFYLSQSFYPPGFQACGERSTEEDCNGAEGCFWLMSDSVDSTDVCVVKVCE